MANKVVVTNIKIPFWSIIVLMIKWSIAAIPAMIILTVIYFLLAGLFGLLSLGI